MKLFLLILLCVFSFAARAEGPKDDAVSDAELAARIRAIQDTVDHIEAEVEIIKAESRMMIHKNSLGYLNQTYGKAGFSILFPRPATFSFPTYGYGLGAFAGVGHYFGRSHVLDLEISSDASLAVTIRYRYEIHVSSPNIALGPVFGYRLRLGRSKLPDEFLSQPENVKSTFYLIGGMAGLPIGRSLGVLELAYLFNGQAFLFANVGFHFFF